MLGVSPKLETVYLSFDVESNSLQGEIRSEDSVSPSTLRMDFVLGKKQDERRRERDEKNKIKNTLEDIWGGFEECTWTDSAFSLSKFRTITKMNTETAITLTLK